MIKAIFTLIIVGGILLYWLSKLIKFAVYKPYSQLSAHKNPKGESRDAIITNSTVLKTNGEKSVLDIEIEFDNFSGSPIKEKLRFNDNKPHLHRFEQGKKMQIMINPTKKSKNTIHVKSATYKVPKLRLIIFSILVLTYILGIYFLIDQTYFMYLASGSEFQNIIGRSPLLMMGLIYGGIHLFNSVIFRFTGALTGEKSKANNWELKYYGISATAKITEYKDTGTLINKNPLVMFLYSFVDTKERTHNGKDTKLIGKLDIGLLPGMKEMDIMYLPNNPSNSRLEENLKASKTSKLLTGINQFVLFVFSVVLVVMFYMLMRG